LQIQKKINLDATLKAAKIVPDVKKFYTIFASLRAYPELIETVLILQIVVALAKT